MLKYMSDTNIEIYTMKKKPALVREAFKKHDGRMGNSSITSITEPSLLRHRERSVAIHLPNLHSSVIASAAWRSTTHIDNTTRTWTATLAWSLLAVTHTSIIVI